MYQIFFLLFHIYMKLTCFGQHSICCAWQQCIKIFFIIPYLYEAQHVSGNTVSAVPDNVHQLHFPTTFDVWKNGGCQCSFGLLMMGGVSPETCWALYKYGIIITTKIWYIVASCWIFLYDLYYDAWIYEHQVDFFYCLFPKCLKFVPLFSAVLLRVFVLWLRAAVC